MMGKTPANPTEDTSNRQMIDFLLKENDKKTYLDIYDEFLKDYSYKKNLDKLGYINEKNPSKISIYVDNFENRDKVKKFIDE